MSKNEKIPRDARGLSAMMEDSLKQGNVNDAYALYQKATEQAISDEVKNDMKTTFVRNVNLYLNSAISKIVENKSTNLNMIENQISKIQKIKNDLEDIPELDNSSVITRARSELNNLRETRNIFKVLEGEKQQQEEAARAEQAAAENEAKQRAQAKEDHNREKREAKQARREEIEALKNKDVADLDDYQVFALYTASNRTLNEYNSQDKIKNFHKLPIEEQNAISAKYKNLSAIVDKYRAEKDKRNLKDFEDLNQGQKFTKNDRGKIESEYYRNKKEFGVEEWQNEKENLNQSIKNTVEKIKKCGSPNQLKSLIADLNVYRYQLEVCDKKLQKAVEKAEAIPTPVQPEPVQETPVQTQEVPVQEAPEPVQETQEAPEPTPEPFGTFTTVENPDIVEQITAESEPQPIPEPVQNENQIEENQPRENNSNKALAKTSVFDRIRAKLADMKKNKGVIASAAIAVAMLITAGVGKVVNKVAPDKDNNYTISDTQIDDQEQDDIDGVVPNTEDITPEKDDIENEKDTKEDDKSFEKIEKENEDLILGATSIHLDKGVKYYSSADKSGESYNIGDFSWRSEGAYNIDRIAFEVNGEIVGTLNEVGMNVDEARKKIAAEKNIDINEVKPIAHVALLKNHEGPTGWLADMSYDNLKDGMVVSVESIKQSMEDAKKTAEQSQDITQEGQTQDDDLTI